MKKIIAMVFLTSLTLACLTYPKPIEGEPPSCYDYRVCLYYSSKGELKKDCTFEFNKCCKDRDYEFCGDAQKRWPGDSPDGCWKTRQ